jgi:hypothetical protein
MCPTSFQSLLVVLDLPNGIYPKAVYEITILFARPFIYSAVDLQAFIASTVSCFGHPSADNICQENQISNPTYILIVTSFNKENFDLLNYHGLRQGVSNCAFPLPTKGAIKNQN